MPADQNDAGLLPGSGHGQKLIPVTDLAGSGQNDGDPAGSRRIQPLIAPDLAKTARIGPDQEESGRNLAKLARWKLATATGCCRIPATFAKLWFSHFIIFSCESNTEKYFRENLFSENDFVEIILRRKSFYIETNES